MYSAVLFDSLKCETLAKSTHDKPLHPAVLLAATGAVHSRLFGSDMLRKVFKNEEEKIPIARPWFLVASPPSAEVDLVKRCCYFSLFQTFIISMLWPQQS